MSNQIIFIDRVQQVEIINKTNKIELTSEVIGLKGDAGLQGEVGSEGKSAYELWLSLGNIGTMQDFMNSLKGERGDLDNIDFIDFTLIFDNKLI